MGEASHRRQRFPPLSRNQRDAACRQVRHGCIISSVPQLMKIASDLRSEDPFADLLALLGGDEPVRDQVC